MTQKSVIGTFTPELTTRTGNEYTGPSESPNHCRTHSLHWLWLRVGWDDWSLKVNPEMVSLSLIWSRKLRTVKISKTFGDRDGLSTKRDLCFVSWQSDTLEQNKPTPKPTSSCLVTFKQLTSQKSSSLPTFSLWTRPRVRYRRVGFIETSEYKCF